MVKNRNSNTKNNIEEHTSVSSIYEAGIGKRLLAGIIDGLFFVFLALILSMWVFTPIANAGMNYEGNQVDATQYQIASHLYVYQQADDDYNYNVIEVKDFTEKMDANREARVSTVYQIVKDDYKWYLEHLHYYYTSYLTAKNIELPNNSERKSYDPFKDNFVSPNYDKFVKDTEVKACDYYTDDWFSKNILKIDDENSYFVRDTSKENFLEQITKKESKSNDDTVKELRQMCYDATADFYYSDYFKNINNSIKWTQIFIIGMAVVISYSVFYILIPLLYKNGETLAKKFGHLAIISAKGYQVQKRQIIFRQIILFIELVIPACVIGIGLTSVATLGVGIVILFVCTLISKTHRSPHDYAAFTLVVDAPKSVWFDSKEDEEKFAKDLDDKMAKYKNKKIIEKSVIQIGDEIVNEEYKKQIEEESKKTEK